MMTVFLVSVKETSCSLAKQISYHSSANHSLILNTKICRVFSYRHGCADHMVLEDFFFSLLDCFFPAFSEVVLTRSKSMSILWLLKICCQMLSIKCCAYLHHCLTTHICSADTLQSTPSRSYSLTKMSLEPL